MPRPFQYLFLLVSILLLTTSCNQREDRAPVHADTPQGPSNEELLFMPDSTDPVVEINLDSSEDYNRTLIIAALQDSPTTYIACPSHTLGLKDHSEYLRIDVFDIFRYDVFTGIMCGVWKKFWVRCNSNDFIVVKHSLFKTPPPMDSVIRIFSDEFDESFRLPDFDESNPNKKLPLQAWQRQVGPNSRMDFYIHLDIDQKSSKTVKPYLIEACIQAYLSKANEISQVLYHKPVNDLDADHLAELKQVFPFNLSLVEPEPEPEPVPVQ